MGEMTFDQKLLALAARQAWVFTLAQAKEVGATRDIVRGRLRSGAWAREGSGVYRLTALPLHPDAPLWIAVLTIGGDVVLSHETAAWEHRLVGASPWGVTVIVPHGSHPRPAGVTVHAIDDVRWDESWVEERRGLKFTSPARTILDLGVIWRAPRLIAAMDDARARGLLATEDVAAVLGRVLRPGKRGMRPVARALSKINGKLPVMSVLEGDLHTILAALDIGEWIAQMPFPGRVLTKRCVDVGVPAVKLVIEADGRAWHTRISDLKRDADRDHEAMRHGWQVLRLYWEHIVGDPVGTAATILEIVEMRRRQIAA